MDTEQKIGKFLIDVKELLKNDMTVGLLESRSEGLHNLTDDNVEALSRELGKSIENRFNVIIKNVIGYISTD